MTYRHFQLSDRSKVKNKRMMGPSHRSHGAGKPSLLPHSRLYLQIRSQLAALREATGKKAAVPDGRPSAGGPNGEMAQRAACTHTWELRSRQQREGRRLDDCEATTAVPARRKPPATAPPSTEPGGAPHAPLWGDVDMSRRGTQRHAPKRKSQEEQNQHNTRSDSGRWLLFFVF